MTRLRRPPPPPVSRSGPGGGGTTRERFEFGSIKRFSSGASRDLGTDTKGRRVDGRVRRQGSNRPRLPSVSSGARARNSREMGNLPPSPPALPGDNRWGRGGGESNKGIRGREADWAPGSLRRKGRGL
ncbi:hypothetical protein ACHAWF_000574, partial [Thalassiosira exigua]